MEVKKIQCLHLHIVRCSGTSDCVSYFLLCLCTDIQHDENANTNPPNEPRITNNNDNKEMGNNTVASRTFTFRELATATRNFRQECLLGEGGFGRVYKGKLENPNQVIKAIEFLYLLLNSNSLLGRWKNKEEKKIEDFIFRRTVLNFLTTNVSLMYLNSFNFLLC